MADQCILSLLVTADRIEITPTEPRYRTNAALHAIAQATSHFWESGVTFRPYTERERSRWRSYAYGEMIGKGHPLWSVPIVIERQHPAQDAAAFDALVERLAPLGRPISLPELRAASEAAYLSTRPTDFDLHHYYA
jgi:hypothetical protein